ncbi:type VI secretion system baseplate subunit TssK [Ewingella americana]|uniref:ImpJ/VasE family protein n=2 Tax=Ewingella americana TaxID=41202 RepID=A0A085GNX7_EWIA3|nr:type VI secretion system baseplate subunit TssK [Ewingella americana]KAA8725855.1 type VI secretion system baseplate subunit TssK [Ewingella americana]KFC85422.1 ImpJ/VasE family protein [Ewingella americana ATCC 33852]
MTKAAKVVWTEGMFLRPHHFQQSESYLLSQVREWGTAQRPYMWGFFDLQFDDAMLRHGNVALTSASGILPDGTPFAFSNSRQAPPPLAIGDNQTGQKVVLALPARRDGREEVIFSEAADSLARHISFEAEADDCNEMSIGPAVMQFSQLRLRLMLESDLTAEWTAIGVALVVEKRNDSQLRLDNGYIPPMLNAIENPLIFSFINDIKGLLEQRSQQIGQRLQQPGRFNNSDMVDFMLLALINQHIGVVNHLHSLPQLHPEQLFSQWLGLATELSTYTPQRACEGSGLPVYHHDDLARSFNELTLMLRQRLSIVMEENAIQLPLIERSHGLNVATVPDANMIREFGFVLAVKANVPSEMLNTHFPAQMKVAPVTKIRDLVQLQLPGIVLRAMPSAPPQIPWHAGYSYFQLEKGGELWKEMNKSGAFALHLAGEFPGLDMAFWAVRDVSA